MSMLNKEIRDFSVRAYWNNAFTTITKEDVRGKWSVFFFCPAHVLAGDFDILTESAGMTARGSFIINPEGKIAAYEVTAGNVARNVDELLRRVQACQFVFENGSEVCPARWQPTV